MKKPQILSDVKAITEYKTELLSKVPLVELAGQNRILIENHLGVLAYSLEQVQIKVSYGQISVKGSNLQLKQLNQEQLVITGQIAVLQIEGR